MTTQNANPFTKHEIYVNEIEFRCAEEVLLYGFLHDCGKFFETQYVISRKDLQTLLSANKSTGIEILWRIEQLFLGPHQSPARLNLIDLFGTTQVLEAGEIKLDVPFYEAEDGELIPCNHNDILFIESVIAFPGLRQQSF